MKFETNFHNLAKKRRELRGDLLERTGKDWDETKKGENEIEKPQKLSEFLDVIETGKITSLFGEDLLRQEEADLNIDIKSELKKMDKQAEGFSFKNKNQVQAIRESFAKEKPERDEQREFEKISLELRALEKLEEKQIKKEFHIVQNRKGKVTEVDRKRLKSIAEIKEAVQRRREQLWQNPETARLARMHELKSLQGELRDYGFTATPSNRKDMEWIRNKWENGKAVLLEGPTGTGKTELFRYITQKLYGITSEVIRCTERTGPSEIFGKTLLRAKDNSNTEQIKEKNREIEDMLSEWKEKNSKATPEEIMMANTRFAQLAAKTIGEGTETYFQPGRYTNAIDHGVPNIYDEFNQLPTNMRFALKELYNRRQGDSVKIQEDSGENHIIQPGYALGATANIKSEKYKERFEFDAAESRVFSMRHIDYLPKEELYDLCLAKMMDKFGDARFTFNDANTILKNLTDAAEEIQKGYTEELAKHYGMAGAQGKKPQLEKAVLDPGQVLNMLDGFDAAQAQGKSFQEFLDGNLADFAGKRDYPEKDRELMIRILMSKGFLQNIKVENFGIKGLTETKLGAFRKAEKETGPEGKNYLTLKELSQLDPYGVLKKKFAEAGAEFLGKDEGSEGDKEDGMESELTEQIETAKEILGEDQVIGPERSEELYGSRLDYKDIPPIQFTKEELEAVKQRRENGELREMLIFIPPNQTIESTQNALKEKADTEEMKATGGLRYINDTIKADHFSTQETKGRWILASEPLESTRKRTAPIQLKTALDELEKMHGGDFSNKYKKATEEFRNNFTKELEDILDQPTTGKSDEEIDDLIYNTVDDNEKREKLTNWLMSEEIAKLLTPNFAEYFAVFALRHRNAKTEEQKEQLQKDCKDYTRIYQKVGSVRLAGAGILGSCGVGLSRWLPGGRGGGGFFSFLRS